MKTNVKETSIECYHKVVIPDISVSQCAKIASYVMRSEKVTRGMIAMDLGMEKSTVSARVNALIAAKVLTILEEKTKCPVSGVRVEWLSHSANLRPQKELFQ